MGGGGTILAITAKFFPTKPSGVQFRHGDDSSRPADPDQFRRHLLRAGSEHRAKHCKYDIERLIGKRETFRITFLEANAQVLGGCALACRLQKVGSDVNSGYFRTGPRC